MSAKESSNLPTLEFSFPGDAFEESEELRPMLNMGCLLDIPTGSYFFGKHGESILNGGLSHITGVGGRGNTFKTVITSFQALVVLDRYIRATELFYENEGSGTIGRQEQIAQNMDRLGGLDLARTGRFRMTDSTHYDGTEFYEKLKEVMEARLKDKRQMGVTPFLDRKGKLIQALYPFVVVIDSLSMFRTTNILKMQEEELGDSARQTEHMRDALVKTALMTELSDKTPRYGTYCLLTAHMGDEIKMDQYAPSNKKLTFLKNVKFKNVPEKFTFLTSNCWHTEKATVLVNQNTKAPEFPRGTDDNLKGDTDLIIVSVINTRSKSGRSGATMDFVISQTSGMEVSLTEFWYIRNNERFGLGGNVQNYHLDIYPDVTLSRTTIRSKCAGDYKLRRAMEITSEMCQMQNLWPDLPTKYVITPKDLHTKLVEQGYDWNVLLDTRGYWVYEGEESHHKPFLSTMDLLRMYTGEYKPWWLDKK